MTLISCTDLSVGYDMNIVAKDLNFSVCSGEYLCILGENGSGKTTLMKTLLHLQQPISGTLRFSPNLKPSEVGYLPQQTAAQKDFPASVWEIVLSGCQGRCALRPFYSRKDRMLAEKNIERMGIKHLSSCCYRELSGGQQQRVLLARALCATGKILVLDEPVSGLDPQGTEDMYDLIKGLNDEGVSIIMITHDVAAALKYADSILQIGKYPYWGYKQEYLRSAAGEDYLSRNEVKYDA